MVLDLIHVFLLSNGSGFGKNVTIFGENVSSPEHVDNRKEDFVILDKGSTQRSGDTAVLLSEAEYSISFSKQ